MKESITKKKKKLKDKKTPKGKKTPKDKKNVVSNDQPSSDKHYDDSEKVYLLEERLKLKKDLIKKKARESILGFTMYTFKKYEVNWHHRVICKYLDKFISGEIKRLILLLPPRNGKSELVSRRLPSYIFGKDPDASIIACSYGADLASKMNRDVQRIIDCNHYRELFPDTTLSGSNVRTVAFGNWLRNNDELEIVGKLGRYKNAGVGGAITGSGANFGIIDDPIKNQEEAYSPTQREKLWDWYISTFYSRMEKDAGILLTVTRWHEDDLVGKLLALAKKDPRADQWVVVKFPAICEDEKNKDDPRKVGEALWPNKYPLNALEKMKANSETFFNALQQQRPSCPKGNILQRSWWKYYDVVPESFDEIIQSWDMSFKDSKKSSYVCGQVWGKKDADFFLLHQIWDQMNFPATLEAFELMCKQWPGILVKLVEDKANGPAIISMLQHKIAGIIPINPMSSKESRATAASIYVKSGNVYLPRNSSFASGFVEEAANFPRGKNDDRVDAFSQAINYWQEGVVIPLVIPPSLDCESRWASV